MDLLNKNNFLHVKLIAYLSPILSVLFFMIALVLPDLGKYLQECYFVIIVINFVFVFKEFTGSYRNINTLFLFLFLFFIGSRVIFDLSTLYSIREVSFFSAHTLSLATTNRMLLNVNIALSSYIWGGIIFFRIFTSNYLNNSFFSTDRIATKKIIVFLFFIGLGFKIKYAVETLHAIIQYGYLAYYTGEFMIEKSFVQVFFESFTLIGLFYFFNKKIITRTNLIILIVSFVSIQLANGQRAPGLIFLVFALFYLEKGKKIILKFGTLFIGFIILYALSIVTIAYREGFNVADALKFGFLDFFWGQGVSINVLSFAIEHDSHLDYSLWDLFANIRFLFEKQISRIFGDAVVENQFELATHYRIYSGLISYKVNPTMYLNGYGLGGSYLAQLYSLGKEVAQFLGGIFVAFLMNYFYKLLYSNFLFIRFLGFTFLLSLIYIPRDNLFDFVTEYWTAYVGLTILLLIEYFYLQIKKYKHQQLT